MGNTYITELRVDERLDYKGYKTLNIGYNRSSYNTSLKFVENDNIIDNNINDDKIDLNYCFVDDFPPTIVGGYLNNSQKDRYRLVLGEPCLGFSFRPGSVIQEVSGLPNGMDKYYYGGRKLYAFKKDFLFSDGDLIRCCSLNDTSKCPKILSNEYETFHCDDIMKKYCTGNPGNESCLTWLKNSGDKGRLEAFYIYNKLCKENYNTEYCSKFSYISKDLTNTSFYKLSDDALITWCKKNPGFKECNCVNENTNILNYEILLGPRECWLRDCTEQQKNSSFLTKSQEDQRTLCKYFNCEINLNNIISNSVNINILNNCKSSFIESSNKNNIIIDTESTPSVKLNFSFCLIILAIFISLFIFLFNRLDVRNSINVD